MTRAEENKLMQEYLNNKSNYEGTFEELCLNYLGIIACCMSDISKSLAYLADSSDAGKIMIQMTREEKK